MSLDSILSLVLGIPIGLVSGLYTGLIVTRYARFAELRNETLRIIRAINFMQGESSLSITSDEDVPKLVLIASDLLFLNHQEAAKQVNEIFQEIASMTYDGRSSRVNSEEYGNRFKAWQQTARELPPNKMVLWALWGKL